MSKVYNIPSIHESLRIDYNNGKLALYDVAVELYEAGWTNFIDINYAKDVVNK